MTEYRAGGFEYRGRTHRFDEARCRLEGRGDLYVDARGSRCSLILVGVPFLGSSGWDDLPGRVWEPDEDQLALYADTFAEGGLTVRDKHPWVMSARVECRRYDPGRGILTVYFRLVVRDEDGFGAEEEVDGVAYCRTGARDEADG